MGLLNKSNKTQLVGIKEIYGDVMFIYPGYLNMCDEITGAILKLNPSIDGLLDGESLVPIFKAKHIRKVSCNIISKVKYKDTDMMVITYYGIARSGIRFKLGTLVAADPDTINEFKFLSKRFNMSSLIWKMIAKKKQKDDFLGHPFLFAL